MAALVVAARSIWRRFAPAARRLPAYARPVFLRLLPALEATGTFKPNKQELVRQGSIRSVSDPLYLDDARAHAYVPLDLALYADIIGGRFDYEKEVPGSPSICC